MTTILAQKGQVVIPKSIRDQLGLTPGDDLEVWVDDNDEIILRAVRRRANHGLAKLLRNAPGPLEIPERSKELTPPATR